MKLFFSSLLTALALNAAAALNSSGYAFNTSDLASSGNNTWFSWNRPIFHLLAPNSWMNDPCAAYYDPAIDGYRIYYQYHHAHVHWGNISFAGAKSDDMVFFEDMNSWEDPTVIGTDQPYGPAQLGVFSGSALVDGYKGYPTIMYTSVQRLPIHWTLNYLPLSETQSLAYTPDDGTTWIKLNDINPVIPSPPDDYDVTGWRDTLVFRGSRAFHEALGEHSINSVPQLASDNPVNISKSGSLRKKRKDESSKEEQEAQEQEQEQEETNKSIFMVLSSGIRGNGTDAGPKVLLYEATDAEPGSDKVMTDWEFLGPLFAPEAATSFSEWSGNWGYNFEMAGYFPLQDGDREMHFITVGTEGGRGDHLDKWSLWLGGDIISDGPNPTLVPEMAGVLDYGELYATNTFTDKEGKRVMLAWTYEDDNGYGMQARGWQGSLVLPRHLSVISIENVLTNRSDEEMMAPSDFMATKNEDDGTWTIKTLGITPVPAVTKLRNGSDYSSFEDTTPELGYHKIATLGTNHFEMKFQIDLQCTESKAGIAIRRSEDGSETTNIYYDTQAEAIFVDRSNSSPVEEFNNSTEFAKFRLWETVDSGLETLNVRLFADGSVVEIYINERFALTTRIYPSTDSRDIGYYTEGKMPAKYSNVEVWDGLANAWPKRPADTSIPLIWDGEPYTNYWPGY